MGFHYAKIRKIIELTSCFFILIFVVPLAHGQSIPITISDKMNEVVFDGKWTFVKEWKASSEDSITQSSSIYLRSAHQDNFIYILIEAVSDTSIDNQEDYAVICFDTKNNQSPEPDDNDYCFIAKLGTNKAVTLQGSEESGEFKVVKNHVDLISVGGVSDENDRYSKVPHASYEFRIPIELLERTDVYGFYAAVYDHTKSQTFTWPAEINPKNSDIPSPAKWGIIYSPDKSLPEYDLPILVLILGSLSAIILSSKNKKLNLFYLNR